MTSPPPAVERATPSRLRPPLRLGIDIGGTFTDVQVLEEGTGRTASAKTPTTPDDPARGLVAGAQLAAQRFGFDLADVRTLMHGTTIATNAVLEGKLPVGALVTTAGFEDILEIGRHVRRAIYSAIAEPRTLLIPRLRRFGLRERVRADGTVEVDLKPRDIDAVLDRVVESGAECLAVCFLHGYANPAHELQVVERARARHPDLYCCASHAVSPELREYERTSTTALNALLMPVVGSYIERLEAALASVGFGGALYLFQSNGGVIGPAQAAGLPVRLLLSGPAGGALAAQTQGRALDEPNLVGVDMGGTSFDVCVVHAGEMREVAQSEVAGCPVRVPMTEIRTISAGGGSIARVAEDGRLRVGPDSAGAVPGPACYAEGGTWPTVTDANVALGRLAPEHFLAGSMALDADAARAAIRRRVGEPLGMALEEAAAGVLRVAVVQMAAAIRLSLFEKGLDPRDFALFSFGGAGGLHAAEVAAELGCDRVIYPTEPATLSAWGMLYADVVHDFAATRRWRCDPAAYLTVQDTLTDLATRATGRLRDENFSTDAMTLSLWADMRYPGQAYEIGVSWPTLAPQATDVETAVQRFHDLHQAQFAHSDRGVAPEVLTWRVRATGALRRPGSALPSDTGGTIGKADRRRVHLDGSWQTVPVVARAALMGSAGDPQCQPCGPLIVEDGQTTIIIPAGWTAHILAGGALSARHVRPAPAPAEEPARPCKP